MVLATTQSSGVRWLGWITLVPLFMAIRFLTPGQSFVAGAFFGVLVSVFSAVFSADVMPATFQAVLCWAVVPGAYAAYASHITRRVGFSPLLLGVGWVGVELLLAPLGAHGGLLARTQGDGLLVHTVGQAAGSLLVGFLVAYINATLLEILTGVCSTPGGSRTFRTVGSNLSRVFIPILLVSPVSSHRPGRPRAPPVR